MFLRTTIRMTRTDKIRKMKVEEGTGRNVAEIKTGVDQYVIQTDR
jgi:hypothetical protein